MNHREPPHLPVGARKVLHCLSLLLLPALAPKGVYALPRPRPTPGPSVDVREMEATPYLPLVGSPPLRFQELAPPPDLVTRPASAGPPTPALTPTESSVALQNAAAAHSTAAAIRAPDESSAPVAVKPPEPSKVSPPPAPAKATPPAILPDDTHANVRPEDFLPYFQIPGSATQPGDVNLLMPSARTAPAPAPLPPSSATYTQSK